MPTEDATASDVVAAFLDAIQPLSTREAAQVSGISHTTIAKLRAGEPIATYQRTLWRMRELLERVSKSRALPSPGEESASLADQLIHYYDHPEFVRRVSGVLSARDRIAAAYAVALGKGFPPAEMAKLDAWRDRLLADEADRSGEKRP